MIKTSVAYRIFTFFNYIILGLLAFVCLLPILHVFFSSISDPLLLKAHSGIIIWPLGKPTNKGYEIVLRNARVLKSYLNTIIYVTASTSLGVFFTLIGGYVLSRKNFLWKNVIMVYVTFTMMFSGGLIPFYMVVKNLGWLDTPFAIIIPGCLSVFNIVIMRTSMMSIPDSLYEAAVLDGADHFVYFFKIAIPLSKATIAAVVLFSAVAQWNSWFNAMIFLKSKNLFPLQLVIREVLVENNTSSITSGADVTSAALSQNLYQYLVQYSTVIIAILPILCIYPFLQKYFVSGIMIGSLKE
jgi:ABC-type sugar transport system, permease component